MTNVEIRMTNEGAMTKDEFAGGMAMTKHFRLECGALECQIIFR